MLISTIITSIFTIFDDMASEYQKMDAFANDTNFAEISLVFLMWALPQNCKRTSKETRLWPRPKDHRPSTRFLAAIFRRKDMEWTVDKGRTDIEAFIEWLWIVVICCGDVLIVLPKPSSPYFRFSSPAIRFSSRSLPLWGCPPLPPGALTRRSSLWRP